MRVKDNELESEPVPVANQHHDPNEPIFDITIPFVEKKNYVRQCYTLQIISGLMIICAAYGMGSHNFSRFLLGCTWMTIRCLIVFFLVILVRHLLNSQHGPLKRYGIFVSIHIVVDIYLFIVVRYYSMECYDAYRYQLIVTSTRIRREPPPIYKSARKTRSGKGRQKKKQKGAKKNIPVESEKSKRIAQVRDFFQKRRETEVYINKDLERVPVWDRKNEVIFYGEDYTEWDPAVFQARWEMLNEKPKEPKKEKPSLGKSKVAGLALALLKASKEAPKEKEDDTATTATPTSHKKHHPTHATHATHAPKHNRPSLQHPHPQRASIGGDKAAADTAGTGRKSRRKSHNPQNRKTTLTHDNAGEANV